MADYADVRSEDTVLEIGCGIGNLTEILLERAGRVVGIEIDERFVRILRDKIKDERFHLITGDFLRVEVPGFDRCVSNIPYSISSPVIFRLVELEPEVSVLTLQREFAERLTADHGSRIYGRISAVLKTFANVEILERVSRREFYPVPDVDSAIVRIIPEPSVFPEHRDFFIEFTGIVFSQRRKKIKNLVRKELGKRAGKREMRQILKILGNYGDLRAEHIPPEKLAELSDRIHGVLYG